MKFEVRFISQDGFPLHKESRPGGLDILDRSREFVGDPNLPTEKVDNYVVGAHASYVTVEVDEQTARASGLFTKSSVAEVVVPPESLNVYIDEVPCLNSHSVVCWRSSIRLQQIAEDWINAGCPAEWNPLDAEEA